MFTIDPALHRMQILVGPDALRALENTRVLIAGVGGVGSWCAEGLIRSGVGHLHIVDSDRVCVTNINRQAQATAKTTGQHKVEALKNRLAEIRPKADITVTCGIYSAETADSYDLDSYDYVIDAIDSISCKVELITRTLNSKAKLFSAMGAACKLDPTQIKVGSFWKTKGCPLARIIRKRLRDAEVSSDFTCVHSEENVEQFAPTIACGSGDCVCPEVEGEDSHEWCSAKKQINGSAVHITGIYGLHLTALVVNDVVRRATCPQ